MPSVAGLAIPAGALTLLVPVATIAEIVAPPAYVEPVAGGEPWLRGTFQWRNYSVTLLSFDRLATGREADEYHRACVFHPLPGRRPEDYFAVLASGEPRGVEVDEQTPDGNLPADAGTRFVAAALSVAGRDLVVPELEALRSVLYPDG